MDENDAKLLSAAVNTLERVSVSGSENMSRLLGCIEALRELIKNNREEADNGG